MECYLSRLVVPKPFWVAALLAPRTPPGSFPCTHVQTHIILFRIKSITINTLYLTNKIKESNLVYSLKAYMLLNSL